MIWDAFMASDIVDRTALLPSLGVCVVHQHIHNYSGLVSLAPLPGAHEESFPLDSPPVSGGVVSGECE